MVAIQKDLFDNFIKPAPIITDITQIPEEKCEKCGSKAFIQAFRLKIVPALQSKTGQPDPLVSSTFICANCRKENTKVRDIFREIKKDK